jgi:hypothetical protein
VEVLAFQSGDLVLLVEVGEGGVAAREAEGAGAARDGDVAALGRGEVERGALEAERATVRARGEAGGEEPRERQRAVAHLVHHADAVRAPQHGARALAIPRRDRVVERDDPAREPPCPRAHRLPLHRQQARTRQHGGRQTRKRSEQPRIMHVKLQTTRPVTRSARCHSPPC